MAQLVDVIEGRELNKLPVGFIIDSLVSGWAGHGEDSIFRIGRGWLAPTAAIARIPKRFSCRGWSEFGLLTEPSAFGRPASLAGEGFPLSGSMIEDMEAMGSIELPNRAPTGCLPLMLGTAADCGGRRECRARDRFATARGALIIAAFLRGVTDFQWRWSDAEATHG
jgi:uroporphyrinogen decarboxylase